MADETDGAIAERDGERTTSEIIRAGANLPEEDWTEARIAAARELVPSEARSTGTMIAYLARATNAGLNPFQGELHVWKDRKGLHFHVAREGWVKILRRDPSIESFEVGAVYENDDFKWKKNPETGEVVVEHSGGLDRGDVKGAYCVLHMKDEPDHMTLKTLDEYGHLQGKDNWQNHPADMLTARATSAAAKAKSEKAAGLVDEEGLQMGNAGRAMAASTSEQVKEATEDKADEIAAELEEDESLGSEIEAEAKVVDEEEDEAPSPDDGPPAPEEVEEGHDVGGGESDVVDGAPEAEGKTEDSSDTTPSTEEEPRADVEPCDLCGREDFSTPQAKSGHSSGHSKRDETIPEGYKVRQQDGTDALALIAPSGVIVGDEFESAEAARQAAWEDVGADPGGASDEAEEADEEPADDEERELGEGITTKSGAPITKADNASLISEIYLREHEAGSGHELTTKLAKEVAPEKVDDEGNIKVMDLDREERIRLIEELEERIDDE